MYDACFGHSGTETNHALRIGNYAQNLELPFSFAMRAASRTESTVLILVALSPVSYREDWAQYEQSSLHPPVLMFINVHIWIAAGL